MAVIKLKIISFFHLLGWFASGLLGRMLFSVKYEGQENLAGLKGGGIIFFANHQGKFDPFLIGSGIPRAYLRSVKCFRYPTHYEYITRSLFGPILLLAGAYPVYPKNGGLDKVLAKTVRILRDGQSVLIFPSGWMKRYFDADEARPGIGYLARTLNPLLVPVFIKNTFNVTLKDFFFRTRKIAIIYGKPFYFNEVADENDTNEDIAKKIMSRAGDLVRFPPTDKEKTFADIPGREKALDTDEARALLASFPGELRKKTVDCFLRPGGDEEKRKEIHDYLLTHSAMARYIRAFPGSAEAFEYLYLEKKSRSAFDNYFLRCKSGSQIYQRLLALEKNLPRLIDGLYRGRTLLIDNIFSGPGRDMIRVLEKNPRLKDRAHIRNIDIDKNAIVIGREAVRANGLEKNFSFECKPFHKAKPRQADLIILVGVLCPLKLHRSERLLVAMREYVRPGGYIVYSTAQNRLLEDDPLTDFFMRLVGWRMDYKSDEEAWDLAAEAGWEPFEQFFDQPLRHHCMTVARVAT